MRIDEKPAFGREADAAKRILEDALRNAERLPANQKHVYLTEEIEAALRALKGNVGADRA